ncbi:type II toxin-antitoxin system RelB/DinJ family antitoxin [uncultured Shewanella sp.]|uniref:type II toxin-antitoxin system RelB/DinJ family antitoxin n=1 Tax=uncultured Shewanella sp. TaxID=173975 RepID=UPI00261C0C44|nr:type II toxin-antitoxin system RelB/DinJ family antitoxin [uncultured Shewanella sp.]
MGTINIRIDNELKTQSYAALEKLGVTPSDFLRQTLEYVVQNGKLPFKQVLLNDEDAELIETARERLKHPQAVKVSLDDL